MPRNIPSIQELILKRKAEGSLSSAPKFLSKKVRSRIESLKPEQHVLTLTPQVKRTIKQVTDEEEEEEETSKAKSRIQKTIDDNYAKILARNQRGAKKFKFDWKEDDDTFSDDLPIYNPLPVKKKDDLALKNDKHWSLKTLDEMKTRDWRIFKEDFQLSVKGITKNIQPLRNWNELQTPKLLTEGILNLGYETPTPIQRGSIPYGLNNFDLIGIAETGSGKTLAFLIPMLAKILQLTRINEYNKNDGPYSLILVPTRELAQQIEHELLKILRLINVNIDVISIVGGKLIERNIQDLSNKNIEIIIATPGRLIDCLERHYLVLNQLKFLILDECDKMIELNFKDQILKIKEFISSGTLKKLQNFMFTATMNLDVEKILKNFVNLNNLITLQVGDLVSNDLNINDRIEQRFEFFPSSPDLETKKTKKLISILNHAKFPVIIFINYKETGEFLHKQLTDLKFKVALIHGSKSQDQREASLEQFKTGKVDILIGTNVASRGIDVNNISLVVNYQMSKKVDDYVHRIGRTGRAGNYGTAVTFLNEEHDGDVYPELKKLLVKSGNKIPNELKNAGNGMKNLI